MYLVFQTTRAGLHYGAFTSESEAIYDGFCPIPHWNGRAVSTFFTSGLLTKIRGHGKLFAKIGLIVPIADIRFVEPTAAHPRLLKQLGTTALRRQILEPVGLTLQATKAAWPHLPHYFLFDTYLSGQLGRETVLAPFDYATAKSLALHPHLLHSYGHRANVAETKLKTPFISLYVGEHVSLALFESGHLADAIVSYSPLAAIMGLNDSGALDSGLFLELVGRRRLPDVTALLTAHSGLQPMTETSYDLETLIQIAGLVPRQPSLNLDNLSIETIEWIELSVRSFLRALRHAIGALMSDNLEAKTLVINTSVYGERSALWRALLHGSLSRLKVVYTQSSLLQAASRDLAGLEKDNYPRRLDSLT